MLYFELIEKKTEFTHKFFKSFPVNTIATAWPVNSAIYQPGIFKFFQMHVLDSVWNIVGEPRTAKSGIEISC